VPRSPRLVLDQGSTPVEDELRLPRPPGVIRRFWARHPLLADILIAVLALLLGGPGLTARADSAPAPSGWAVATLVALTMLGCLALVWRRRWPIAVFAVSLLPSVLVDTGLAAGVGLPAAVVALYSIAVYRSARACWIALGASWLVLAATCLARIGADGNSLAAFVNATLGTAVAMLIAALIGVNVGNRKRYLAALIDRSRQLLIERDQRGRLAASAERTRIAREMHDIVSHSLAVIIALADGASATDDPARSREAARAAAQTAREALGEMREMLGVLRDDDAVAETPLAPPLDQRALDGLIESARSAGLPATLVRTGGHVTDPHAQLAVHRIVQEGLTNALRYARQPTFVRVTVTHDEKAVTVTIDNDGSLPDTPSSGSVLGLRGLQERVAYLGGDLTYGIADDSRWRLRARLPKENTA